MNNAIVIENLGHSYLPGKWIFRHYNAALVRGQTLAILGANGAGKSTLLRLILNLVTPTEGHARVEGRTAFVPQLFQVGLDYSALDMVLMGRARQIGLFSQPSAHDEEAAMAALDHFGLADIAHQPFHELSGGQRQLVVFARAVVSEADILVLDEPASTLDLKNQEMILSWIAHLSHVRGLTIIFTTHQPQHAFAVADKALLMISAENPVFGNVAEVVTEANLSTLYGVELKRVTVEHAGLRQDAFVPVLKGRQKISDTGIITGGGS